MSAERLTDLEMKLAFLERTVEDLHEVLLAQGAELQRLRERLTRLEARGERGGDEVGPQHDPPPHY
ncbi:MAG: SlyX family protein [Planctomycetes bacterium]|nr:SlyX family protein [Planctomycetota bacterium]